jgi:cytochrome c-type biogenesis protein CcmH
MQNVPNRRHFTARAAAWLLLSLFALTAFAACVAEDDLTPDQRAYTLDRELMCPVCDGQTIDQSLAQIAQDMKVIVREKIADGDSNEQIRTYFMARYGEVVLAAPDASGFNLLVWLLPAVIAGGGGLAVVWVLKNMLRSSAREATGNQNVTLVDRQLEKYLEKVDADIGYKQEPTGMSETFEGPESGNG